MVTTRLQRAVARAAQLPAEVQDMIGEIVDELVEQLLNDDHDDVVGEAQDAQRPLADIRQGPTITPPPLRPELRDILEQSLREHAAIYEYLRDK